ncbi:hypothetical protein KIH39_21875 [Telmatocola sphagniphila]|uniref:Hydrazine synthase alpha subunit middle domain-containing protein n=1 Tax=Telmatocola sphagniphila TaxID=1123043 RepID=A0A8E6B4V4_9BACT|nr:hypothetical protein [Telmatocola sphagniphila]QVL31469.1 hypothetical protein KIH39_21875 [Telmatocola sphagniphila]
MMRFCLPLVFLIFSLGGLFSQPADEPLFLGKLNITPPSLREDKSVRYDFDIVYVRMPRKGDSTPTVWPEIDHPLLMEPGADLMLLHPDGQEELLVQGGLDGAIMDPVVSLDGKSVYYVHLRGLKGTNQFTQPPFGGSDIYKLDLASGKKTLLTEQKYEPNTGATAWGRLYRNEDNGRTYFNHGVFNTGPCPLPGGKLAFVSSRYGFQAPKHSSPCLQLFVMDEDTGETECIGFLNAGMALHPVVLRDGRIMFSSFESQGLRNNLLWGIWGIHPDGTNWEPIVSAFDPVNAPNLFHFQAQLSDGSLVIEEYYNHNNAGFGSLLKLPTSNPEGYPPFGPGHMEDPRNPPLRFGRYDNGKGLYYKLPFSPHGVESFTRFASNAEGPAGPSDLKDPQSIAVGKFTHPAPAPENNLLVVWSPGPVNTHLVQRNPVVDAGIYMILGGKPIDEPGQMRLIKNDPRYNEIFPKAVVPYERIYGIKEPKTLPRYRNDGSLSTYLPAGTPFGLIGTSSLYKRESYPNGYVAAGTVTAGFKGEDKSGYAGLDPFNTAENGASLNWFNQGAEAGKYSNDDIHAIRILLMEPTTDRRKGGPKAGRLFRNHANERLRILGEIPVRKFDKDGKEPLDTDGNPDTSFLARIPADTAFTFQTLDKNGMVLNMSQTWHQLRPGEIRHDCGGCHAHSQKPTEFAKTKAAQKDYVPFDLVEKFPMITTAEQDQSHQQWDKDRQTGIRYEKSVRDVEYFRDIKPIFEKSCVACHTEKSGEAAAKLVLDDNRPYPIRHDHPVPSTYFRLAMDKEAKFGYKPLIGSWRQTNASRYIREFQSRRSLLVWKVFGRRLDGWTNEDFPTETKPGDPSTLTFHGQSLPPTRENLNKADLDYTGSIMPPPEAVAGTYKTPDGKTIQVEPLTEEDKRNIARWIDLGCPLDIDYHPARTSGGFGWFCDDQRPVVTVTSPQPGVNKEFNRILIGLWDVNSGLDQDSWTVKADFEVNGQKPGSDLSSLFKKRETGIWELQLSSAPAIIERGEIIVTIRDNQGNTTRVDRIFSHRKE